MVVVTPEPPVGFAEQVEDATLRETRRELLREAQHWLTSWERHRDDCSRGRLLQTLETLALLVPGAAP